MDFDVVVVGSGLVGTSLALALKTAGLKLAVVEAQPPQPVAGAADWDNRVYAISPGSAAFLERCGVWRELDMARVSQVEAMRIVGDDDRSELDFSAYDAGLRELAFIVENRELQRVLWDALKRAQHVEVIAPAACKALTLAAEAAQLELGGGRMLHARLLIGADGADSWVRAQAAIEVEMRRYHQTAVVANFATTKPHRGTAYQWFRRDGVLALLPLPDARVSLVWSTTEEHAAQLLELAREELAAQVVAASHGMLGDLTMITPAAAFPLRLQRVRQLVMPRLALAGDAAHNVHPLAGQGVNLGFRDARELARVLLQRGAQTDCGDYHLLRRYERARREDIVATQFTTDLLQRLFNNEISWLAELRNFGLRLTNRRSQLKNLLVQHAVG
jgi:2-octaprenylphenol hydroxylase